MSIKKKFATAVATAGLLAGLFGSAFVPVARAGADDATLTSQTCTGSDNTGSIASAKQTCTYKSTVAPVLTLTLTATDADDIGVYTATVSGSTLTNFSLTGTAATKSIGLTTSTIATANVDVAATTSTIILGVTLAKISAGSSATVTFTDDDSTIVTVTVNSIATAKAGVVATVGTLLSTRTLVDDIAATGATAINGTTTVNSSVDYMAAAYNGASASAAGNYGVEYAVKDAYNTAVDITAKLFTATISPATCGSAGVASTLAGAVTAAGASVNAGVGTNAGVLFVNIKHPGADAGCKAVVTVTESATGTVLHTFTIGMLGETASITLAGPAYMASGLLADTDLEDQITVVTKDSQGIVIPGEFANPTFTVTDELAADIAESFVDTNANAGARTGVADDNIFDLDNAVCAAGKEGKTRTIYAEGETLVATGKAKSNTLTLTCTGKTAYVSAIAFAKAAYLPTEVGTVTFTLKDVDGRVSGVGSDRSNAGFSLVNSPATGGSVTAEPGTVGAEATGILVISEGKYDLTYTFGTAAGVAGFVFDVTDNDGLTSGNQQGLFTVKTVVNAAFAAASDATISAGPLKKIATATFGAAAGKKVAFVLENASGVTKTYYRKANASGVAKYTIALNGTWTVYATFGDEITDTVTLRK